jgi:hypothetical protein
MMREGVERGNERVVVVMVRIDVERSSGKNGLSGDWFLA